MNTDTIPPITPNARTQHDNPVIQALAIITEHFKPADDGSDDHVTLTIDDVYDILRAYTAQYVDTPGFGMDYATSIGDDRAYIAAERGNDDGHNLVSPIYRADDQTHEAINYVAAYRDAAHQRIEDILR